MLDRQRLRGVGIGLFSECLAEGVPVTVCYASALIDERPHPHAHVVNSAVILLIALGFVMLTIGEFWRERRSFDMAAMCGFVIALVLCCFIVVLHDGDAPIADDKAFTWFAVQAVLGSIALIYAAVMREI